MGTENKADVTIAGKETRDLPVEITEEELNRKGREQEFPGMRDNTDA